MNYLKELNAFDDWLEINPLEATTQTLWYRLMAIANKSGWPEWFTVANLTLQAKLGGVSKATLIKHRNILVQKRRIEYIGQGKQTAGKYKIITFSSINEPTQGISSNIEPLREPFREPLREPNSKPNLIPLFKQDLTRPNGGSDSRPPPLENPFKFFEQAGFGTLNQFIADKLGDLIDTHSATWVLEAMKIAAFKGKRNLGFVNGILNNWQSWGIDDPWTKDKWVLNDTGKAEAATEQVTVEATDHALDGEYEALLASMKTTRQGG